MEENKPKELGHIKLEDLDEFGVELYAGILLLDDLIRNSNLSENFRIRCSNLKNHWIGQLMFD